MIKIFTAIRSRAGILPTIPMQEEMEDLKVESKSGSPPRPILPNQF